MELISVLQVLERRRLLVALGLVIALLAGLAGAGLLPGSPGAGPAEATGLAQARLLLDTPAPLAADLDASADTIGAQAALLGDLMAADHQVGAIARDAGVPIDQLLVRRLALTGPAAPSPLGIRAAAAGTPARPYSVDVRVSPTLPILSIDAFAPDVRDATALAEAATTSFERLVADKSGGLTVKSLEPGRAVHVAGAGGRGKLLGLAAALGVFVLWCCAVVLAAGLARAARKAPVTAGTAG